MAKKQRTLRFEMPFTMGDPSLVTPELGIARAQLKGRKNSFAMDITLLDSPDHRLLRAGIVLAHRVIDGLGEWYLDAPGWGPWLPTRRTEKLGAAGDLPQEFAALVRPFRRHAPLGPVAAVGCQRREWQLLAEPDEQLATVRDDKLTIRRGGVTTARYREVTIRPEQAMTRAQRDHIVDAMLAAGGTPVEDFPSLAERIGAPATGLTDFRGPRPRDRDASLEGFVSWLFSKRLDGIMRADLQLRSGGSDDMDLLRAELADLRREVRSLSFALEPHWREQMEAGIEAVLGTLASRGIAQLGDEYFTVLDMLVVAIRAPRLGDQSQQHAQEALLQQATRGATILFDRAHGLNLAAADDRWAATLMSASQMHALARTLRLLFGKGAKRLEATLEEALALLRAAQMPPTLHEPHIDLDWDPVSAFQEGRHFERRRQEITAARRHFLEQWPDLEKRIRKARKAKS
ncbi:hypothetical protein [Luteococcus peritonei]|uniref:Adenylate cyclase n=1 Tax=Luteococcus peritonei TaxID=88874 RepID=A0ABW4RV40_9ACTN